jgi:ribulose 1,5-bisphosphate synthetase/thiazole synthase
MAMPRLILAAVVNLALSVLTADAVKFLKSGEDVDDAYDYVIAGGGTSGLTVADRLTEDGKCNFTLLELLHRGYVLKPRD